MINVENRKMIGAIKELMLSLSRATESDYEERDSDILLIGLSIVNIMKDYNKLKQ